MKKTLFFFGIIMLLFRCGDEDPNPPTKASLVFPFENSECNEGTNITATESTVLFEWFAGENTDEFELMLADLSNGEQTSHRTSEQMIPIVLQRGTPYAWYIVSRSNEVQDTAQSEIWKFYNAGEAVESYAPFPAEIITPMMAETISPSPGEITLDWKGSDVDGDIAGYDVYFGTTNPPELLVSNLEESVLTGIQVVSGSIYYWSITTKDAHGNSSASGIFQFKIL